jgi:hypothetical protein
VRRRRLISLALALYPPWWRERYGNEVAALSADLITDGQAEPMVAWNLLRGALRARLLARGMPDQPPLWRARSRVALVVATAPVLVVLPLIGSIQQIPYVGGGPLTQGVLTLEQVASYAYLIFIVAFWGLMSTALFGYLSLSNGIVRVAQNDRVIRRLARCPLVLLVTAVAALVLRLVFGPHSQATEHGVIVPTSGHPLLGALFVGGAKACLAAGWVTGVVLLWMVARRGLLTFGRLESWCRSGVVISMLLWLMAIAGSVAGISYPRLAAARAAYVIPMFGSHPLWVITPVLYLGAIVTSSATSAANHALNRQAA